MRGCALPDTGLALGDLVALAKAADDLAYDSVWVPEFGSRDAILVAALLGAKTSRVRVAAGVVPVFARNPVSLSLASASAAEAARGRFVLGLGAGHRQAAEGWYGAAWKDPRSRLAETVEIVRAILSGKRVNHDGELHIDGFHLPQTPPPVPIFLGALTPESLRMAGRIADGTLLTWMTPEAAERASLLVREAAADAGRQVQVGAYVRCAVVDGEDDERLARTAAREHTYTYLSLPAYAQTARQAGYADQIDRLGTGDDRPLGRLTEAFTLIGDTASVRDRVQAFEEAGVDLPIVQPIPFGEKPAESVLRTIRALADQ